MMTEPMMALLVLLAQNIAAAVINGANIKTDFALKRSQSDPPMILPAVSIFIKFSEYKDNLPPNLHSQTTIHVVQSIADQNEHLLQVICMMLPCKLHQSSYQ